MAQIEIPLPWRQSVCQVLRTGKSGREIIWTHDASQRFEADFSGAWQYEAHDDLRRHLSLPMVTGCPITMVKPVGTTYEFMFVLKKRSSYGKILLTPDKKLLYIFSAHLPLKSKLSCQ